MTGEVVMAPKAEEPKRKRNRISGKPMTEEDFQLAADIERIGGALNGTHWQSDVAKKMDYSKSMMTKVLQGTRRVDINFMRRLRGCMIDKIEEVASLLGTKGLPKHTSPETREAIRLILQGVAILRKQQLQKPGN